jgi:DNA-directed RNA polymerase subunit RPC12/RpoP
MKDFVNTLNEEQKKALLEALNSNSPTLSHVPDSTKSQTKAIINEDFTMNPPSNSTQKRRKEAVRAKTNMWVDTGESKDVTTPDIKPTPRRRQPPQKVKLQCHVCGKDFEADKRFVFGEYNRCDRCASKK